jgi:tripartite-type tricarboxylate transporter receptor subunit TctC
MVALLALAAMALPVGATDVDDARNYPVKPVHLIVAFPAGTAVDGLARLVGSRLDKSIGQ